MLLIIGVQIRENVRQTLTAFDFSVGNCGVTHLLNDIHFYLISSTGAWQSTATVQDALRQFIKQWYRCAITGCPLSVIKLLFSTMSLDAIM
jgi:hypothetical protein